MPKVVLLLGLSWSVMLASCGKPQENVSEYKSEHVKIDVRTREYHNSGVKNLDVCAMLNSSGDFPSDKGQCFMTGYDFSGLTIKWKSESQIEISFICGRVSSFNNFALVPGTGGRLIQIHANLIDNCDVSTSDR